MSKLIIVEKEKEYRTITIRLPKPLLQQFTSLASETGVSRNELICAALEYGLQHMRIADPIVY